MQNNGENPIPAKMPISTAKTIKYLKTFGGFWKVIPVWTDDAHHYFRVWQLFGEPVSVRVEIQPDDMQDYNVYQRESDAVVGCWAWIDAFPMIDQAISCS